MSRALLRITRSTLWFGALFLALPWVQGQESSRSRGQPILFSDPQNGIFVSNTIPSSTEKPALKNVPEGFNKSLQTSGSEDSLGGAFLPPLRPTPPPMIQSKRVRELIEKRKDWVFLSAEEMVGVQSTEDILSMTEYDTDGKEKEKRKPVERYHERLDRSRDAPTNAVQSDSGSVLDPLFDGRDTQMAAGFRKPSEADRNDMAQVARKLFDVSADREAGPEQSTALGFGNRLGFSPTPSVAPMEQRRSQQERLKQFEQMLGYGPASAPLANPLSAMPDSSSKPQPNSLNAASGSSFQSAFGQSSPDFNSSAQLPGLPSAPSAVMSPSLSPQLPQSTPNRMPTLPQQFSAPKRPF